MRWPWLLIDGIVKCLEWNEEYWDEFKIYIPRLWWKYDDEIDIGSNHFQLVFFQNYIELLGLKQKVL